MNSERYESRSAEETLRFASDLARGFKGTEIVLLYGDLGAGKTVFAKGLAAGLNVRDVHDVSSPSFTLVNIYEARVPIVHIDLYRLDTAEEIEDLGWEDYLERGVLIVEWAEKLPFHVEAIRVHLTPVDGDPNSRSIRVDFPPAV